MTDELAAAAAEAEAAREDAAVGAEFAEDWIEPAPGIRLYYATVAHKWVLLKLSGPQFRDLDNIDKATVMAYVLSFRMPENLTRLAAEMRKKDIFDRALTWLAENRIDPEVLGKVDTLLRHPYAAPDVEKDPTSPAP